MNEDRRRELTAVVLFLAAVAGAVDASAYLELGKIFIAHMSGNSAAAAADLARGDIPATLHRAFPILVFTIGLFGGAALSTAVVRARLRASHAVLFGAEAVLLAGAIAFDVGLSHSALATKVVVVLATAAMALQSAAVSRVTGIHVRTTALTGMLTNFAEEAVASLTDRSRRNEARGRAMLYGGTWLSFVVGGAACGLATLRFGLIALSVPVVGLCGLVARDLQRPFGANPPALGEPRDAAS